MLNISIVLDLANDYSVNAGVFRDSGNFVKEYANLCSATALYLLALQSEQLDRDQRQELITKCESYIKLQEEIELTRFSFEEAIASSPEKKKRKRIPTFKKAAETSFKTEQEYLDSPGFQQQQLLQHASIINDPSIVDEKDVILAAQETHEYYSESDDSVDFNLVQQKSKSAKKKTLPKKSKIKTEPKTPGGSDHPIENVQLVQVVQDPVVVSAPDHFGYCEVTPTEEVSDGFYNFSAAQLKAFSERFKGKIHDHSEVPMLTPAGKSVEREKDFLPCRDFICPEESRIREWFPDAQSGKLRAKALDPYGLMVGKLRKGDSEGNFLELNYKCQYEYCHVKITLRKIKPDSEGNSYGLFGCNAHPHELPMENRSELVFANKAEAWNFFEDNWRRMYLKCGTAKNYTKFLCRRKNLGKGLGYHNCTSVFSMSQTFPKEKDEKIKSIPVEDKPHSINGIFYHTHENDEKYHRHSEGGWRKHESNPTPRKKKYQPPTPRIRNGEIYPIYARKTHTVEGLLAAQEARRKDSPWLDKSKKSSKPKKKKKVVYNY